MRVAERSVAGVLLGLTVLTGALTLTDAGGPFRLLVTLVMLVFVLLAPGWAVAVRLNLDRPSQVWCVACGVGLAGSLVLSTVMIEFGFWYPTAAMQALVVVTAAALIPRLA